MKTRILIRGEGFGGVYAALELDRTIAGRADIEVTIDWMLDLFFSQDLVQFRTERSRPVRDMENSYSG